jgi:hypothetical protein
LEEEPRWRKTRDPVKSIICDDSLLRDSDPWAV